jgi:predicted GH43/DUF377 family glycosyl hydrolase
MSRLPRIKISKPVSASFLVLFLALGTLSATFTPPILNWSRLSHKPTLSPRGHGFESAGTFNPAVTKFDGKFVMLYRAQDRNGTSSLGYATSSDGVHFRRSEQPAFRPETDYEKGGGVEDPRLQKIGDIYYMTYTGFNNVDGRGPDHKEAQLCLAASRDLVHWDRKGVILPANTGSWNVGWTKSGAIVPQKIDGKYWMYYLGDARRQKAQMGVASSPDLLHWTDALDHPVLSSRPGMFDAHVVEPGPPPLVLPAGIFLIYNGADQNDLYSTGWVLFDANDPTHVVARASKPVFWPSTNWEKIGQVPNVVFVEGLVREPDRWLFYYGAADKYVGVVRTKPIRANR